MAVVRRRCSMLDDGGAFAVRTVAANAGLEKISGLKRRLAGSFPDAIAGQSR